MFERRFLVASLAVLGGFWVESTPSPTATVSSPPPGASVCSAKLLRFEANVGQWDLPVRFVARGAGTVAYVTADGVTFALEETASKSAIVSMTLVGSKPTLPLGEDELDTKSNFFLGKDTSRWRANVPNFARLRIKDSIPGVDLVWYGREESLEYDLQVAAGTDASTLSFDVQGADALQITDEGALEIITSAGTLVERPPRVTQGGASLRARYRLDGPARVSFDIDGYDEAADILIDPVIVYSTYLGGSGGESGLGIVVDSAGNAYVTGYTTSTNFPTASAYQGALAGGTYDAFVTKLKPSGSGVAYSTYLGGSGDDRGAGVAVDSTGNAYVIGSTASTNFPTANATQNSNGGGYDAFITKLTSSGSVAYSTYLGGNGDDWGLAIAADASGATYLTGVTGSTNFPTASAYQAALGGAYGTYDAFITKLDSSAAVTYSTYLGGTLYDAGHSIAIDTGGDAFVTGYTKSTNFPAVNAYQATAGGVDDAFVVKVASTNTVLYSTYLGGSGSEWGQAIAADSSGCAYVAGHTGSANFPIANAYQASMNGSLDAFVTKLTASGNGLSYSTYLGGSTSDEDALGIVVDSAADAWVVGYTSSTDFPMMNATQPTIAGSRDVFVSELSATGASLAYSSFVGGSGADLGYGIAIDSAANVYVTGFTQSIDYPTKSAYQTSLGGGDDVFVTKLGTLDGGSDAGAIVDAGADSGLADASLTDAAGIDAAAEDASPDADSHPSNDGGATDAAIREASDDGGPNPISSTGCGCTTVGGERRSGSLLLMWLGVGIGAFVRRRRAGVTRARGAPRGAWR